MIRFDQVSITYPDAAQPVLRDVDLTIEEGSLCLVVGRTGSGKSTLLGAINGLVPHFTGGRVNGTVTVGGRATSEHPPHALADLVGTVQQDPLAGFVTETVEEELAYTMEQLGVAPAAMRKRVEEVLDLMGIAELRARALRSLSGGQQQRVAIGAVLTANPRVLVLDEPTSALDPVAAEEVLATVVRLVHDLGMTVVVSEHRLERVLPMADVVVHVPGDGTVTGGPADLIVERLTVVPPVVGLGRLARWQPIPFTVRDARRHASDLRRTLTDVAVPPVHLEATRPGPVALDARAVTVQHPGTIAVREVDLTVRSGTVTALMGRNGSGKTSLLWALQGTGTRSSGVVTVAGRDPASLPATEARRHIGLVPQTPTDLLFLPTVAEECARGDQDAAVPAGTTAALLARLATVPDHDQHPRDLSEGQRLALALAIQLVAEPPVLLLDEPTRGLDGEAKAALATVLRDLAGRGKAVVVSTHDVEFVAEVADQVVVLADGEVVADGSTAEVVVGSPAFAPQVAKVLAPLAWLTVGQVRRALAEADPEAVPDVSAAGSPPGSPAAGLAEGSAASATVNPTDGHAAGVAGNPTQGRAGHSGASPNAGAGADPGAPGSPGGAP